MTGTPGHIELERSIDSIRIGSRHRADLGDIDALAASIERQGLLQPITVTPDGVLVCGARRLAALRQLGVRKLNVWVRAGISDRLTELLAEQDDNTLHKPLSPTESATLYRELKQLLAEEAARRQEASRFQANGENPRSDGGADSAPPSRGVGRSREQAARLVTGQGSYSRLEQIGDLQRIAGDESTDASVRALAVAELDGIDRGGAVSSAHQRVSSEGALRAPFPQVIELDLHYYLLVPDSRIGEPPIVAFREWLLAEGGTVPALVTAASRRGSLVGHFSQQAHE